MREMRLRKLLTHVKKAGKDGVFDIMHYGRFVQDVDENPKRVVCASPACIAGFTIELFYRGSIEHLKREKMDDLAGSLLGLNFEQKYRLFLGRVPTPLIGVIDHRAAIKTLKHFIETGKIVWDDKRLQNYLDNVFSREQEDA